MLSSVLRGERAALVNVAMGRHLRDRYRLARPWSASLTAATARSTLRKTTAASTRAMR